MEKIIEAYKEVMRRSSKKIKFVLLVEMIKSEIDVLLPTAMILSETQDEWIIHPVSIKFWLEERPAHTGDGSYMFKDMYTYEEAKERFKERIVENNNRACIG